MTTTKKAVDPNDPAPIACQKLIMEFSDSVYMRVGATRALRVRRGRCAHGKKCSGHGRLFTVYYY